MHKLWPLLIAMSSICFAREEAVPQLRNHPVRAAAGALKLDEKIDKLLKLNSSEKLNACLNSGPPKAYTKDGGKTWAFKLLDSPYAYAKNYFILGSAKYPDPRGCYQNWFVFKDNKLYVLNNHSIKNDRGCFVDLREKISIEKAIDKEIIDKNIIRDLLRGAVETAEKSLAKPKEDIKAYLRLSNSKHLERAEVELVQKHLCSCEKLRIFETEIEEVRNSLIEQKDITFKDDKGDVRKIKDTDLACGDVSS